MSDHDIPVEELGELLDKVSEKVPALITNLLKSLYSPESGKNIGMAVGSLYKELVESGMPQDEAIKMARDFMLSIKDITGNMNMNGNQNNN